jgi:hemolysin activation/secretion protein
VACLGRAVLPARNTHFFDVIAVTFAPTGASTQPLLLHRAGAALRGQVRQLWLVLALALLTAGVGPFAATAWGQTVPAADEPAPAVAPRFVVRRFDIEGATLVPVADLQAALRPWLGKPITLLHLQHAARVMAEVYRAQGWPVRPQVPAQDVVDGVVTLVVDEMRVAGAADALTQAALPPSSAAPPVMLKTAAALPDAGALLREQRRTPAAPAQAPPPPQPLPVQGQGVAAPAPGPTPAAPAAPVAATAQAATTFEVRAFRVLGATQVPEADVQALLAPLLHRALVFAELQDAARAVAELYRQRGWLARAQWPAQDLQDGVLALQLFEARLGQVRLDEAAAVRAADPASGDSNKPSAEAALRFDRDRLVALATARQPTGEPLNLHSVNRAVHVINTTPGLRAQAVLAPGDAPGLTDIIVQPQDQPLLSGHAALDNHGSRAAGATRASASVVLASPSRMGDELALTSQTTSPGNHTHHLQYSLPWGLDGLRLGAHTSVLRYRLRGEFAAAQGEGGARTWGLKARYPLTAELGLQLGAERRHYANRAAGQTVSDKQLTSLTATLTGDWAAIKRSRQQAAADDSAGAVAAAAPAATPWSLSLMQSQVNLAANPDNQAADSAGPRTANGATRLAWTLAHLQPLGAHNTVVASASGQWASSNLDSADKFSLGGPHGLRAYPSLEGTGDTGWLVNLEWRHSSQSGLQWLAFYDVGQVHINRLPDFAAAPAKNTVRLHGVGVGLNWQPSANYTLQANVARRLGQNPQAQPVDRSNPANNAVRDSDGGLSLIRAWVSLTAMF